MKNDIHSNFKKIKENTILTESEKIFHRAEILKFISKNPTPLKFENVRSPFQLDFFYRRHLAFTSLAVLLAISTTLGVSAQGSLPNSYLYSIKTKVTEPALVLLTPSQKSKTALKVSFVGKRLQEFSQVTLDGVTLNDKDKTAFLDQFSTQVQDAHQAISQLAKDKNAGDALKETNDLQSILSSQNTISGNISSTSRKGDESDDLSSRISGSIEATTTIENDITDRIQDSENTEELDKTIAATKDEISKSLNNIEVEREIISTTEETLHFINKNEIDSKLSEINEINASADKTAAEGNKNEALKLYNLADQKLGELESILRSEKELNSEKNSKNNSKNETQELIP